MEGRDKVFLMLGRDVDPALFTISEADASGGKGRRGKDCRFVSYLGDFRDRQRHAIKYAAPDVELIARDGIVGVEKHVIHQQQSDSYKYNVNQ